MTEENCAVIKFCVCANMTPTETFKFMQRGKADVSRALVFIWHRRFTDGLEDICDQTRPGRPRRSDRNVEETVKPHIPLIKFRKGQGSTGKVVEMVKAATSHNPLASQPNQSSSSNLPKVGNTPRGSAVIQDLDLPTRYHRKLISEEEIAFIERGGPE